MSNSKKRPSSENQIVPTDVLNDPEALANTQEQQDFRLKALQSYHNLPAPVKRRVKALKKLQLESLKVEADFFRRMNDLEREFEAKYAPIFSKRRDILVGDVEPAPEECEWPEDEEDEDGPKDDLQKADTNNYASVQECDQLAIGLQNKASISVSALEKSGDDVHGVPDFWLTIFRNVPLLSESKEECDDAVLSSLRDIQCHISGADARPGFYLEFHFAANDYFTDAVLRKDYFVRFDPSAFDPLGFEGPEIVESKGCVINWKAGKNVTVKTVKKTMKHKNRGEKKTVSKVVKTNSFFNFFDPPKGCIDNLELDDADEDMDMDLQSDFELGQYIREQVIPRAVLLYTGEGVEDEDDYESEGEGEEEEDEEDEEEHHAPGAGRGGGAHRQRGNSHNQQQECKQQ